MKTFTKILAYVGLIISLPFMATALVDFRANGDSVNIFIFCFFLIPFALSVKRLLPDKSNRTQQEIPHRSAEDSIDNALEDVGESLVSILRNRYGIQTKLLSASTSDKGIIFILQLYDPGGYYSLLTYQNELEVHTNKTVALDKISRNRVLIELSEPTIEISQRDEKHVTKEPEKQHGQPEAPTEKTHFNPPPENPYMTQEEMEQYARMCNGYTEREDKKEMYENENNSPE